MKKICRKLTVCLTVCMMLLAMTVSVFAAENVDWENKVIRVTGTGVPPATARTPVQGRMLARRAAIVDGYRMLAETISGVDVTGESNVGMLEVTSDVVKTKVSAVVRGARVVSEREIPGGGYEVVLEAPLFGISNSLAGAVIEPPAQPVEFPQPVPEVIPSLPADSAASNVARFSTVDNNMSSSMSPIGGYTGLIVDCRGLGLKSVMSPVIKNERGISIYGHENLNYDLVVRDGMVDYASDMSRAGRAGGHPLVLKAVSLSDNGANPVLSVADANRVLIENGSTGFLNKTSVVFLR
ncbi:LPP20 lipoprotein [Selenomonas ruminantium]|uniref:LPP20 lipoprotein n=1 Tax=Selenomonas ruminantium TaxID=971 RepID=A0A1M6WH81_SELRU|nr:LPP20 family lipoprotein [Selenomonas ruminantium]SHK93143.1 LPP20 lipoprotein [Selenomonas ruminantium]